MVVKLRITESQRVKREKSLLNLRIPSSVPTGTERRPCLESAKRNLNELERGFRPEEIDQARAELAEAEATARAA